MRDSVHMLNRMTAHVAKGGFYAVWRSDIEGAGWIFQVWRTWILWKGLSADDKRKIEEISENADCKKVVRKGGQKTVERLVDFIGNMPGATQQDMVDFLGINRSAIQKHLSNLKAAGRLRRIGPDKGGHWEVVGWNKRGWYKAYCWFWKQLPNIS